MPREMYRAAAVALLASLLARVGALTPATVEASPTGPDDLGAVSSLFSTRLCPPSLAGVNCSSSLYPLQPNAPNPFVHLDAPLAVGDMALFRWTVNCVAQDAILTLEKHGNATDTNVTRLGVGSEVELAVQYGTPPTIDDGGYIDGVVSFADEPDAWMRLGNVFPGVYYAGVHVSAGEPLHRFTLALTLEGSRVPNPWNRCEHADDQLLMDVTVTDAIGVNFTYTRLGPVTGADAYPTALGKFFSTLIRAIKNDVVFCLQAPRTYTNPLTDTAAPGTTLMSPPTAGLASFAPRRRRHSRRDSTVKQHSREKRTRRTRTTIHGSGGRATSETRTPPGGCSISRRPEATARWRPRSSWVRATRRATTRTTTT